MGLHLRIIPLVAILAVGSIPYAGHGQYVHFRSWDDKALNFRVLEWGYDRMMEDHIRRIAFEFNAGRTWPEKRSALESRQREIRRLLWRTFGLHLLKKVPLTPRITGQVQRDGYTIEKLIFTSLPGVYVTGNVYVPEAGGDRHPAILCPHGHWPHGRFQPEIQARCIGLAKLGYVVLSLDKYGYGERRFTDHGDAFYLLPGGLTLEGLQIWDNMRAIDYLVSRSDVDADRIGITGASGGGNQTMYTAALDTRIAAALPAVSVNTFDGLFFRGIGCVCEGTPNILRFADEWDVLACIAPRYLLILANLMDSIFPVPKARETYFRTRKVYQSLEVPNRVAIRHFYDRHSYNRELRETMYGWFEHVFRDRPFEPIGEKPRWLPGLDFDELRAVEGGRFPEDARTLTDLAIEYARRAHRQRAPNGRTGWRRFKEKAVDFLREEVFGGFPERDEAPLRLQVIDETTYRNWTMKKLLFWSDWDVLIPAIFVPAEQARGTVILAHSRGKSRTFLENWVEKSRIQGYNVLTVDLRGIGETKEEHRLLVQNGLVAGKPVIGEWVWDLMRCLDVVQTIGGSSAQPVYVMGDGVTGLAVGLLSIFDERVTGTAAIASLVTYMAGDRFNVDYLYYLHRVLEAGDIPDLLGLAAPKKLILSGPIDPSGAVLRTEAADNILKPLRSAYALQDAGKNLVVLPEADIQATLAALLK